MEKIPNDELPSLAEKWKVPLHPWQIRGRSLLNRDAKGNYKFAHRSIMEYLFVFGLIEGNEAQRGIRLTDLMKEFLIEMLEVEYPEIKSFRGFLLSVDLTVQNIDDSLRISEFQRQFISAIGVLNEVYTASSTKFQSEFS